jgi:hypothetical protein
MNFTYFVDGVHPTHNTQIFYGWIKKEVREEVHFNAGRPRINLSGKMDVIEKKVHLQENLTLHTETTIDFFRELKPSSSKKGSTFSWIMPNTIRIATSKPVTSKIETH